MSQQNPPPTPSPLSRRGQWAGGETIISTLMARALAQPDLVSLAAGFVDQATLPVVPIKAALAKLWSDPAAARASLQYGTTVGHPPLREIVLRRVLAADGCTAEAIHASTDNVLITAGSNQLLYLLADVLLDPGDIVLCAAPSYFVFLGTLANVGARAVGVATDEQGLRPDALEQTLAELHAAGELPRVKALYLVSYFDNPAGISLPLARRREVLRIVERWSQAHHIYVIEDAAYRALRYANDDVPSLRSLDPSGETVVYAGTFSKSFSPGIRVGWGLLPPALMTAVVAEKGNIDFGSPHFNQVLMSIVLSEGLYEAHVAELRIAYQRKIDAALGALKAHLGTIPGVRWIVPAGGIYVWVEMPPEVDTGVRGRLFDLSIAEGMLYVPGEYCYPQLGSPVKKNMLRLSIGVPPDADIIRGVAALGRAARKLGI